MIKMAVVDVDGVLINNVFLKFLGNGQWLKNEKLKRLLFSLIELLEKILKIRHPANEEIFEILKRMGSAKIFLLTDRSSTGLKNIRHVIESRGLLKNGQDFIQLRRKEKITDKVEFRPAALPALNYSSRLKPHISCLYNAAIIAEKDGIEPYEVLVIDDCEEFLEIARKSFGFKRFPQRNTHIGDNKTFIYLLERIVVF